MSTKLKIVSDLHYDFYDDHGKSLIDSIPNDGIDILVIAGDLTTDNHLENLSQLCGRFPQVVFVLGNHDYFRFGIEHAKEHIRNIQKFNSNLHYLDNDIKEINGVRFAGCTLWYPRPKDDIHSCWIDYRYCNKNMIWEENRKSRQFLKDNATSDTIVVSHHLPSDLCVAPRYLKDPYNVYFVGNCDNILDKNKPKMWIYGHTHTHTDRRICSTRCICNPYGYPNEYGVGFDKDLVIEV